MKNYGTETVVYARPGCPYCDKAKQLLSSKGVSFREITVDGVNVTKESVGADLGVEVTTVPQIVLNGKFIPGGFTGLKSYYDLA